MKAARGMVWLAAVGILLAPDSHAQQWVQSSAPQNPWSAIAMSADGTRIVAAAAPYLSYTSTGGIYTSSNSGATWFRTYAPKTNHWASVACSADATRIIASAPWGGAGSIYMSSDGGSSWQSNSLPQAAMTQIAMSADGSKIFGGVGSQLYSSMDSGATWSTYGSAGRGATASLASSADGRRLVWMFTGAQLGLPILCISTNGGAGWRTNSQSLFAPTYVTLSADGCRIEARAGSACYVSKDCGATWQQGGGLIGAGFGVGTGPLSVSADGSRALAYGAKLIGVTSVNSIFTWTDSGQAWVSNTVDNEAWTCVAMSADGNVMAVASDGMTTPTLGYIWVRQALPQPSLSPRIGPTNLTLSWIVASTNLIVQQRGDLRAGSWADMTNTPILNTSNLHNEVSLPVGRANAFYRLKAK